MNTDTKNKAPYFPNRGERLIIGSEEHSAHTPVRTLTVEELLNRGVINLDKPAGPTSHQVVSWIKDMLGVKRTGHSGTLDPGVSGVLPVALGSATKLLKILLIGGKEYVGILELKRKVKEEELRTVFKEFTGPIYQIPPEQAAVKRQLRIRRIYDLELLEFDGKNALFRTNTESGTYIRTLCYDIGLRLGTVGKMAGLRRTRSGHFYEKDSVTLQELKDGIVFYRENSEESLIRRCIQPVEKMVEHLPVIVIRTGAVDAVCHGAPLARPGALELDSGIRRGEPAALFTPKAELVAVVKPTMNAEEIISAKEGVVAQPLRVVMEPDSYPRMWKQRL